MLLVTKVLLAVSLIAVQCKSQSGQKPLLPLQKNIGVAYIIVRSKYLEKPCAATLIAPKALLTSAHCLEDVEVKNSYAVVSYIGKFLISKVVPHPDFNSDTFGFNVAIAYLITTKNIFMQIALLPTSPEFEIQDGHGGISVGFETTWNTISG